MDTTTSMLATPTSSPAPDVSPTTPPLAEEQERFSSLALFVVLALLIGSFWTSYYLKIRRITAVHETIVGLFAGMFVGAALRIGPGEQVQKMLSFSNTIMLNVLLPPIILASGYDLRQENFFRNFGTILTFAFAGTFISAIVIGVVVYLWSMLHLESLSLSLLECLIFGSTLSATDPVTILAIFNTYKVDPQLYSVIFGESLLNDAVSIVMFDVLSTFRGKPISIVSLFHGLGLFFFVFTFSMALGVAFGLSCSLMLKHSRLASHPPLESALVLLIAYTSYFFSNGVTMSGIVSLLFCGITLKHYAYHNMSRRTQRATRYIFKTLANISENFIFIYLGLSLFTQDTLVYKPLFILVTVAAVVVSRYSAVFPIAAFVNMVKRAKMRRSRRSGPGALRSGSKLDEELPREYQIMLFWAGLRGAVGFALSAGIEGQNASALQTTVLVAVVLTVIVFGGTTPQMLEILGIRTGVEDDEGDSTDEEEEAELSAQRLRSLRHRRRMANQGGGRKPGETRTLFGNEDTERSTSGQYGWASGNTPYADDGDDGRSSSSTDVLPPRGPTTADTIYGLSSEPSTSVESPNAIQREFAVAPEDETSVHRFLDRAGLIMRDGRWFSTLDRRYLTPLFTNSVASRKHEERKAMRRSEAALSSPRGARNSTSYDEHYGDVSGNGSGRGPIGNLGPLGPLNEIDAEVVDEEEDDDAFAFGTGPSNVQRKKAYGSPGLGSSSGHSAGTRTPTRRPISRSDSRTSFDDGEAGGSGSGSTSANGGGAGGGASGVSRISGAFGPSTPPGKSGGGSSSGLVNYRSSTLNSTTL